MRPFFSSYATSSKRPLIVLALLLGVVVAHTTVAHAATYYVDSVGGSDSSVTPTSSSTPWQTIAKVNASTFSPGDSILFKRGDTWREQLTVPTSGNASSSITFGAYGSGTLPQILSSVAFSTTTNWSVYPTPFTFYDGFESGTTTAWTSLAVGTGATMAVASDSAKYGAYSLKIVTTAPTSTTDLQKNLASPLNPFYSTFFFKSNAPTFGTGGEMNVAVGYSSGLANQWKLFLYNNGTHFYLYMQQYLDSGSSYAPGYRASGWLADSIVDGTWHRIDVYSYAASGTGAASFTVDGTPRGTLSALANNTKGLSQYIQYGAMVTTAPITGTFYFDDVYANSSTYPATTNVWYAYDAISPAFTWRDNAVLTSVASAASLNATSQYYWDGASKLGVWTSDGTNPATSGGAHSFELSSSSYGVYVNNKTYITVDGISTSYAGSIGMYYTNYATNGTIKNSVASYSGSNNIAFNLSNSFDVHSSTLSYANQNGITAQNSSYGSIYQNDVSHAGITTDDRSGISLWLNSIDNLIYHNHAHDSASGGSAGIRGIILDTVQGNGPNYVYDNETDHDDGGGIDIYESDGQDVYYNVSHDNTTTGSSTPAGIKIAGSVNANVWNNVVYNNAYAGILGYTSSLDNLETTNAHVKNNIVLMLPTGNHYGIMFNNASNTIDYNLVYGANNSTDWLYDWPLPTPFTPYTSAATLYAATAQGKHDVNADPAFVSSSTLNFVLRSSSPAINAGLSVGLTADYVGNTVPTNRSPDMGAYEYSQTSTPSVAMTAPTASSTVSGSITVSASSSAVSPASIASIQFYLDGSALGAAGTSSSYSISWDTTLASNASHTLYALATDNYANTATSTSITVTVLNQAVVSSAPPSVAVSAGGGGSAYDLAIDGGAPTTPTTSVTLSLYGTAAYTMEISNTSDFSGSTWIPYVTSLPWTLTPGTGEKTVFAKFRAISGTVVGSAQAEIEIAAPAPSLTGGANTSSMKDLLSSLQAQLQALRAQASGTAAAAGTSSFVFTRDLQLHDTGTDVQMLQQYLNSNGFTVSSQGFGSPGNETVNFGVKTRQALSAFQKSAGITPAAGYFGAKTRAYMAAKK